MARDSRITRTVKGINVTVMVVYTDTMEVKKEVIPYTGNATEDAKILKDMRKSLNADNMEIVKVLAKEETEQLYGMTETDFIKNSVKLDNRQGTRGMVTRTVKGINVTVMVVYTDTMEVKKEVIPYTGNATEDAKILKDMRKSLNADNMEIVKVLAKEETEQLYGMTETDFIKNSVKLDNRFDTI